ncbi:BZ3500_MvSof-1268-A1-R1_Chr6-3g08988 [Microbotryum saponariae]|uniref:BZ3500_MvSof-1268-A1-R1_Chr6-3g08988 protein n=1 Tax=Microbotryum saponariae TaxID=289078 RepID=A0A2X0LQ04_9BASI|nr:BZ3500_MvSof-1268-A1-R1_Chr6-3g08988 [Microbotryum saponariae]SDA07590.1 BZ3501_MvSof-1269-A2-R1_Chr6-2g08692 [Microbotryum saponariae]
MVYLSWTEDSFGAFTDRVERKHRCSWKERRAVEEVCAAYARIQECLNRICVCPCRKANKASRDKTGPFNHYASAMSHINVACTKAILGTFFGNIHAGNWSIAKEPLEMALDSDGHLVPLQTVTTLPTMLAVNAFTKAGVLDAAGWYNHQQTHRDAKAKQDAIVNSAKAHLMMCVGQATYVKVKDLPAHQQWAKLESVFATTSSIAVDRRARLVELVSMPQFVVGDDFEAWLATFRATVNAINNAVKQAQPSTAACTCDPLHPMIVRDWLCNLIPEAYALTISALGDDFDIGKWESRASKSSPTTN